MKRYGFRLETVRRVRRTQEDIAKAELARANNEVRQAAAVVESRRAAYEEKINALSFGPATSESFMRRRHFDKLSGDSLLSAQAAQTTAEHEATLRHQAWSNAAQQVKALDRLDDRKREEYRTEYDRTVEKEVDDIVIARARMQKPETGGNS